MISTPGQDLSPLAAEVRPRLTLAMHISGCGIEGAAVPSAVASRGHTAGGEADA
jgi:hypothetical protein